MENIIVDEPQVITIRPARVFAFVHVLAFMLTAIGFLLLAWRYWPGLVWISLLSALFGLYRFWFIRCVCYTITPEIIRIRRGIFFKRTDQVELFRVKGAHVAAA